MDIDLENVFVIASVVSVVFFLFKFVEMRMSSVDHLDESTKSLKYLLRNTVIVYVSTVIGYYILSQFSQHKSAASSTEVFLDTPDF